MTRRTRRGISAYARSLTSPVAYEAGDFGRRVMFYDGIPVFESDFMVDTETIASAAFALKTGGTSSSIFAVKVGEGRLAGLTNGGIQIQPSSHPPSRRSLSALEAYSHCAKRV